MGDQGGIGAAVVSHPADAASPLRPQLGEPHAAHLAVLARRHHGSTLPLLREHLGIRQLHRSEHPEDRAVRHAERECPDSAFARAHPDLLYEDVFDGRVLPQEFRHRQRIGDVPAADPRHHRHVVERYRLLLLRIVERQRPAHTGVDSAYDGHMASLLCARTWPGGWTFAVYQNLTIVAYSTSANATVKLGKAASPPIGEAIVRCLAGRTQVNGFRIFDGVCYAATGAMRRGHWPWQQRVIVPGPAEALAKAALAPALIPFVYRPGDTGFVITAVDAMGRYAVMPAYGPTPEGAPTAASVWLSIISAQLKSYRAAGRPPPRQAAVVDHWDGETYLDLLSQAPVSQP